MRTPNRWCLSVAVLAALTLGEIALAREPYQTVLTIPTMDCGGCARRVEAKLKEVRGVAAQGRALQAGLYPNPTVSFVGEEIGKNGGIHTLPQIGQEIVTGKKLTLSRSVALREVDQAHLALMRQRYALFTTVRQG
jgi:hypothetical protein